jgi:aspartyl-tRNA synthetase
MRQLESILVDNFLLKLRPDLSRSLDQRIKAHKKQSNADLSFPVLTYRQAMQQFGTDKPDLRLKVPIKCVTTLVPPQLKQMLSSLDDPEIEIARIPTRTKSVDESSKLLNKFMNSAAAQPFLDNPHGVPGATVYDPAKPLNGLASFGHECAAELEKFIPFKIGDLVITQARPKEVFRGASSTPLGNLRRELYNHVLSAGLLEKKKGLHPVWINDFPLFTRQQNPDGTVSLVSTHHPFTAPQRHSVATLRKLKSDPSADAIYSTSFDLVINGVEVGGGSQRIHYAPMQEFIFREVLKLSEEQIEGFRHLLDALKMGCPPHTGFAFGFDRLLAVILGRDSVRDVIAFPKYGGGEDPMFKAPFKMSKEQLSTYHLAVKEGKGEQAEEKTISMKA